MKPLIFLIVVFFMSLVTLKLISKTYRVAFSARIAMCFMLCFTALGHFMFAKGMSMMLPDFIPMKTLIIYATGIIEIVAGIFLLISATRKFAGLFLIIFFILLLPANIKSALEHLNYETGTYDGSGPEYLWFRVPLQLFFIVWIYFSSVKQEPAPPVVPPSRAAYPHGSSCS